MEAPTPKELFKYCPKCAASFVAQKDNSLRCQKCGFRWYFNAACAVDVIIERGNEILMTWRTHDPKRGSWDLPGGFVNADESVEEAAWREVAEEVGLELGRLEYFSSFPNRYVYGGLLYYTVDLIFRAAAPNTPVVPRDDVARAEYIDPETIPIDDIGLESTRRAVSTYIAWRRGLTV